MSNLIIKGISVRYGKSNILDNISFKVEDGCLVGILGANGCGKTTLLKAICGILPHEGVCTLDGQTLEGLSAGRISRLISYIPQRSGISIDISALDVVLMGFNSELKLLERPKRFMKEAAVSKLTQVGLTGKENINYMNLSEGQKQLCILARTLVRDSKLLLLDEPESALDFQARYKMLDLLKSWINSGERSAVVTLHDPYLALNYCDKLLLLSDGEIIGCIQPVVDSLEKMEKLLSVIYGNISLQICCNRKGKHQLVMLREDE